jgi:hypothetical protein
MNTDKVINIRKMLGIEKVDTREQLEKYRKLKKRYTPIFLGLFALSFLLMVFAKLHPDFTLWALFINVFIFGELDRKVKVYEVGELLKNDDVDIEQIKKRLLMQGVKDISKVNRRWQKIGKVYAPFCVLLWIGVTFMLGTSIIGGISLSGIASAIWLGGINYMLYDAIKYRQKVYAVGMLLEENSINN